MSGCTPSASAPGADNGYKATINAGIGCLASGDTLNVRTGTYNERITDASIIPNGTGESTRTKIVAVDGARTVTILPTSVNNVAVLQWPNSGDSRYITFDGIVFDGTNVVQSSAGGGNAASVVFMSGQTSHIRFINTEVRNGGLQNLQAGDTTIGYGVGGDFHEFLNCSVHHNGLGSNAVNSAFGYGWYISFSSDILIDNCDVHDQGGYGVHSYSGSYSAPTRVIVRNSRFYNNGWPALQQASPFATGAIRVGGNNSEAYNNLIYGNASTGIECVASPARCYNNTVYGNGSWGIYVGVNTVVKNNIVYNNALNQDGSTDIGTFNFTGAVTSNNLCNTWTTPPGQCSVTGNPLFVNAAANDFHLQSSSPAINQGATLGSPYNIDKDGNSRPVGCCYDIGAYEYGGTVSPPPPPPPPTCTNLWNSTLAVPASFGASFNWFSSAKELLMSVLCSSNTATLNVGNSSPYEYIYKTGYIWQNSQWTPFNYGGSNMSSDGNWFIGSASNAFASIDLTQKQSVLAYICDWNGSSWQCGCHDSSCATSYWNLQQFKQ